jgi:1,4-alpha-glucan branching enzyme
MNQEDTKMIERQPGSQGDEMLVTFTVPGDEDAWASLVGEFNDWSPAANPMERDSVGVFSLTLPLSTGRTYRFRYLFVDGRWENDPFADGYVPNEFGGEDSVLDLTGAVPSETEDLTLDPA